MAINPRSEVALASRGEAKKRLGQFAAAILDFDAALAINPRSALALVGRGDVKKAKGELLNAILDYEKAVGIKPHDIAYLEKLNLAYKECRKVQKRQKMRTQYQLHTEKKKKEVLPLGELTRFFILTHHDEVLVAEKKREQTRDALATECLDMLKAKKINISNINEVKRHLNQEIRLDNIVSYLSHQR